VIVVLPGATPVAAPVPDTVATVVAEELHTTVVVRPCIVPSLYIPVAANCSMLPAEIEEFAGATAIDTNTGGVTVNVVEPLTDPIVALMVALPCITPLAKPVALIVAACEDVLHVTDEVKSWVPPSV